MNFGDLVLWRFVADALQVRESRVDDNNFNCRVAIKSDVANQPQISAGFRTAREPRSFPLDVKFNAEKRQARSPPVPVYEIRDIVTTEGETGPRPADKSQTTSSPSYRWSNLVESE